MEFVLALSDCLRNTLRGAIGKIQGTALGDSNCKNSAISLFHEGRLVWWSVYCDSLSGETKGWFSFGV